MMMMVVAAQVDFEAERKAMQVKMEAEVQELQTHLKWASRWLIFSPSLWQENEHLSLQLNITLINFWLRLFQKVDQWMNKDEQMDNEARKKLDDANQVFRTGRYHQILLSW